MKQLIRHAAALMGTVILAASLSGACAATPTPTPTEPATVACDPAEMTRLKGRHDTLRGTVDEITLPSGAINWGFLVVTSGYSKLESDAKRRRDTMHKWCDQMSGAISKTSSDAQAGDSHWASVIEKDRRTSL